VNRDRAWRTMRLSLAGWMIVFAGLVTAPATPWSVKLFPIWGPVAGFVAFRLAWFALYVLLRAMLG
jgi:predicted RNase H-like nuclease